MCTVPREYRAAVYGVRQEPDADDVPAEENPVYVEEAVGHHLVHE
ncbi:hypothetical protein [Kribbella shirazensis]|jgi:hypothetical protein|uniref:Uncharacterized protein n=1 Tax=Kribbella shirazensis TaxID=1105143 RepID=A0A7X5VE48_9ACTN|nr:hypothetical protein [Kribbella shirazensis]NIK59575.1 hypothetical protein [Kribbella shirazensis]